MTTVFMEIEISESTLRRFLLGDANDDESAAIGARLFDDDTFAASLELAEDALIEDYLAGELDDDDRLLFESSFLTTPERQKRFSEIRLLMIYARRERATDTSAATEQKVAVTAAAASPFGQRAFFSAPRMILFASALIIGAIFLVWYVVLRDNQTQAEIEYQARNQQNLELSSATAENSVVTLSYQTFRDQTDIPAVSVTGSSESIMFRLPLPTGTGAKATFNVSLALNGSIVFRQRNLPIYQTSAGRELRLLVPRTVLQVSAAEIVVSPDELKYRFRLI